MGTDWGAIAQLGIQLGQTAMGLFSSNKSVKSSRRARDTAIQLQQMAQNWSTEMASTAHQREVADLRAAGLNPLLSANGGATTPGASAGSATTFDEGATQNQALSTIANSAIAFAQLRQQKKLNDAQIEKLEAEKRNIDEDTTNKSWSWQGIARRLVKNIWENKGNISAKANEHINEIMNKFYDIKNKFNNKPTPIFKLNAEYNKPSNAKMIHTKHGDLYDIDDLIRKKYNVH